MAPNPPTQKLYIKSPTPTSAAESCWIYSLLSIPALDFKIPAACAIETISPNAGLQVDSVWAISTYFNKTTRQHTIDPKSAWIAWWVLQFAYTDSWSGKPWTVESWESIVNGLSQGAFYLWDSLRLRDTMRYLHNLPLHPQDLEGVPFEIPPIHLKIPQYPTIWDYMQLHGMVYNGSH